MGLAVRCNTPISFWQSLTFPELMRWVHTYNEMHKAK